MSANPLDLIPQAPNGVSVLPLSTPNGPNKVVAQQGNPNTGASFVESLVQPATYSQVMFDDIRSRYPNAKVDFSDTFPDRKMHGWGKQFVSASTRFAPTLGTRSRYGGHSLQLETDNSQGGLAVAAKFAKQGGGKMINPNVTYLIYAMSFSWVGYYLHNMYRLRMEIDSQWATRRAYMKAAVLWSANGSTDDKKLQYDSVCNDTPTWADVPSGAISLAWNEPSKPSMADMYMVVKIQTGQMMGIWFNGTWSPLSQINLPAGTTLTSFDNCFRIFLALENRGSVTTTNRQVANFDQISLLTA